MHFSHELLLQLVTARYKPEKSPIKVRKVVPQRCRVHPTSAKVTNSANTILPRLCGTDWFLKAGLM